MDELNKYMKSPATNHYRIFNLIQFINNRLYFIILDDDKDLGLQYFIDWKFYQGSSVFYISLVHNFSTCDLLNEFKVFNLGMVYYFINLVKDSLKKNEKVAFCVHYNNRKYLDIATFLIGAYMIIEEDWTSNKTFDLITELCGHVPFIFRDSDGNIQKHLSVKVNVAFNALFKAKWYGFFDSKDFDLCEFDQHRSSSCCKLNWIIPGTMLAFLTPNSLSSINNDDIPSQGLDYFYQYFQKNNVKHIIRLSSKQSFYVNKRLVTGPKIKHLDLYFKSGTTPPDIVMNKFLTTCDQYVDDGYYDDSSSFISIRRDLHYMNLNNDKGSKLGSAVAIRCKGIGRTGCLISCYIMKNWSFTAYEALTWVRLFLQDSINCYQQKWLDRIQPYLVEWGTDSRKKENRVNKYKRFTNGVYSVKRHTSTSSAFKYVDPPPLSALSIFQQNSTGNSTDGQQPKPEPITNDEDGTLSNGIL